MVLILRLVSKTKKTKKDIKLYLSYNCNLELQDN